MVNEENQLLGATVPQDWIVQFEELAKQTGRSVTELVREALGQYIGIAPSSKNVVSQLEKLQMELKLVKQKMTEVELYKTQIKDLSIRVAVVEQNMGKTQSQLFSSEVWLTEKEIDTDDIDDEPDEVLTDFLS